MENRYAADGYKLCSAFMAPSILSEHYKKLFTAFSVFTHATLGTRMNQFDSKSVPYKVVCDTNVVNCGRMGREIISHTYR